jgi:SAM-dependent methyltransferase
MRNKAHWRPTKYLVPARGKLRAPARSGDIWAGSVLIATLIGRWYRKELSRHARGRLLDLGCGKVPLYEMYAPHVQEIICTDWPATLHGEAFIDFANDLNTGIPLRDATFDTIVLSDVLEHIFHPDRLLREIHRVLRPGATALINTPFLYLIHEAPYDFYRYTPYALERMAGSAGLEVIQLDLIGGGMLVIADVLGKLLSNLPVGGAHLASALQRVVLLASRDLPQTSVYPLFVAAVLKKPLTNGA